jgi:hypothetical protein
MVSRYEMAGSNQDIQANNAHKVLKSKGLSWIATAPTLKINYFTS